MEVLMRFYIVILICLLFSFQRFAKTPIAKILLIKGDVSAVFLNGDSNTKININTKLYEGMTLNTAKNSIIKLKFLDGSKLILGPLSKMKITRFKKNRAGVISLMKGQLRSMVTKDYMKLKEKKKSKLYITTKTSAMGIRGTDFQVKFNSKIKKTELFVKTGKVAMAQVDTEAFQFDDDLIEKYLADPGAVIVTKGKYSSIDGYNDPLVPRDIGKMKIRMLKSKKIKRKQTPFEWEDPAMRTAMIAMQRGEDDVAKYMRRIKSFKRYFNKE
jgi:hypothetical protein